MGVRLLSGIALACAAAYGSDGQAGKGTPALDWCPPVPAADGGQAAAAIGPDGVIHFLSDRYFQINADGSRRLSEPVGDERQGALDFYPALAVGRDGAVHAITRHGGDWNSGHQIRYRRRNPAGRWDLDLPVGKPGARNYVVAAAVMEGGRVFVAHSVHPPEENMNSYVELYEIADGAVLSRGRLPGSTLLRADDGFCMESAGPFLHLATGSPWPGGSTSYFAGPPAQGLPRKIGTHAAGNGRKGSPWMASDGKGFVHITYGAEGCVWYNKVACEGRKMFPKDVLLGEGLGRWHLSVGISGVAASADGRRVLAVLVRSDGSKGLEKGQVLWTCSSDGGIGWTQPRETPFQVHCGEGRRRPILLAGADQFYLFFTSGGGFQLARLKWGPQIQQRH